MLEAHNTMRRRSALREALMIACAGALLGFGYTGVMGKGFFAPPPVPTAVEFPPEYIDYMDTYAAFEQQSAAIIDSRSSFDYELGHIKGSLNLPLKEFETRKDLFRTWAKDTLIITYCDGQECNSSMELANKIAGEGFTNVKFFFGGWTEWQQHHSPEEAQ